MDMDFAQAFLNPFVVFYLIVVVAAQLILIRRRNLRAAEVAERRRDQGLPDGILMDHAERLADRRREALHESLLLLATVFVTPFILNGIASLTGAADDSQQGLAVVFVALILWILLTGTDVAKAALAGLAFKTLAAYKCPFQVGDRVTLKGVGGKVISIDSFYVMLQTPNDDLVSIPTASLWGDTLVSANAGERSSLCVMNFYLASLVDADRRQAAEDAIWDSIQASPYFEPAKPAQIYLTQNPDSIQLTAKAYVASTYNEPLFSSDVTRAFLAFAANEGIPLASGAWRVSADPAPARPAKKKAAKRKARASVEASPPAETS